MYSEETILHTLRDCERAKAVWLSIINPCYMYTFLVVICRIGCDGTLAIMRAIQGGANGLGRNVLALFVGRSGRIDARRLLENEQIARKL